MIRVAKSAEAPNSLQSGKSYNGQDVQRQLIEDQHSKCYICERHASTDYQIEHLQSRDHHPELTCHWPQLFLSCSYCNGKKSNRFDTPYSPAENNVEDEILQSYNPATHRFTFSKLADKQGIDETINLLDKVHNGNAPEGIRNMREEQFFRDFIYSYITFTQQICEYNKAKKIGDTSKTDKYREAIASQLTIDSEYLAIKIDILRTARLLPDFAHLTTWNRK